MRNASRFLAIMPALLASFRSVPDVEPIRSPLQCHRIEAGLSVVSVVGVVGARQLGGKHGPQAGGER